MVMLGMALLWLSTGDLSAASPNRYKPDACPVAREMTVKGIDFLDVEYLSREHNKGLRALERASVMCPNDPAILYNLALAYYQTGRKEDARNHWRTLVKRHPNHEKGIANLAWVNFDLGDDETAHNLAFKALRRNRFPNNLALAHTRVVSLFRMARYLEAYDWLTRADLNSIRAAKWKRQAAEYVVEKLWQRFRRGERFSAIRRAVNLLIREYPSELRFIEAKDMLIRADLDSDAEIPYPIPLPHETWAKSGPVDEGQDMLDDFIQALPTLNPWEKRSDSFAVFTGIYRYKNVPGRYFADRDARNMHTLLTRRGLFKDNAEKVRLRLNEEASREVMLRDLNWLVRQGSINPNAMLLFYFSGHGKAVIDPKSGKTLDLLLVPMEIRPEDVRPANTISLKWLRAALEPLQNREVAIIIDSCFVPGGKGCLREGARTPLAPRISDPAFAPIPGVETSHEAGAPPLTDEAGGSHVGPAQAGLRGPQRGHRCRETRRCVPRPEHRHRLDIETYRQIVGLLFHRQQRTETVSHRAAGGLYLFSDQGAA